MTRKIKWILFFAIIIMTFVRLPSLRYYYNMCGWMANYRPRVYVPMYTCIYQESYGSSSWQVVTWMNAVPMGQ